MLGPLPTIGWSGVESKDLREGEFDDFREGIGENINFPPLAFGFD